MRVSQKKEPDNTAGVWGPQASRKSGAGCGFRRHATCRSRALRSECKVRSYCRKGQYMIVSFDLDGVLFVDPVKYEIEQPLRYPFNRFYPDRLRKGTVDLIHRLKNEKFQVWVYTSSYRRERYIKGIFWHYHVKFDKIINGTRHDREVQRNRKQRLPSKLPSFYRISLHIDDEESVMKNGQTYGFRVLRVSEPDPLWAEKVLQEAIRIREIENRGK